jgi:hypothetical protein
MQHSVLDVSMSVLGLRRYRVPAGAADWAIDAVDLGFLVPGCAGWQDVASELVALADRLMRLAHGGGGGVGARRGTLALVAADGAVPVSPGAALLEEMLAP